MDDIIYIELNINDNKNYLQDQKSLLWLLIKNDYVVWETKEDKKLFLGAKKSASISLSSFNYIPVTEETFQDVLLAFVKSEKMVYCYDTQNVYYKEINF